ncbi:MAG: lipocalin-like domain-containing protein [Chloroflexota bacterium]
MAENALVGVWKLVSCDATRKNGTRIPIYGKRPVGRLFYDAAGNMSVHIMKSGRRRCESETKFGASDEEMKAAYEGYEAYFSKYAVDTERRTINHKVLGSLFPNWTGSTQTRYYAFDRDNRLVLSTEPIGASRSENTTVRRVWERLELRIRRNAAGYRIAHR